MMSHILLVIRIPARSRDPSAVAKNLYYECPHIEDFGCGESAFFIKRQKCDFKTGWACPWTLPYIAYIFWSQGLPRTG